MPQLNAFEKLLNDEWVSRKHIVKIHTVIIKFLFFCILFHFFESRNMGSSKHHFESLVQKSKVRDTDVNFIWKLFLRVAEIHIVLA
jgi:hypothetical protein